MKRCQPLARLIGLALASVLIDQAMKVTFGKIRPRVLERNLFGEGVGVRRVLKQCVHHALTGRLKLGKRHHLMQESDSKRLCRIKSFASECIAANLPDADGVV